MVAEPRGMFVAGPGVAWVLGTLVNDFDSPMPVTVTGTIALSEVLGFCTDATPGFAAAVFVLIAGAGAFAGSD